MAKVIRLVENPRGFSSTNRHTVFYRHDYDASLADNSHVFFREFDYVGCNWELQLARWSFFDAGPEEDVIILDQYNLEAAAFWFAIGVQRNLWIMGMKTKYDCSSISKSVASAASEHQQHERISSISASAH